jgi:hypothetical protein
MYDLADLAGMLGELVLPVLAAVSLVGAAAASGRLAAYFMATAVLCGISLVSGVAAYSIVDQHHYSINLTTRVIAVAIGFLWGPVAAGVLGFYWLRKGK